MRLVRRLWRMPLGARRYHRGRISRLLGAERVIDRLEQALGHFIY